MRLRAVKWPLQGLLVADVYLYDRMPLSMHSPIRTRRLAQAAESTSQTDWSACVERIAHDQCRDSFMQLFDYYAPRISRYLQLQGATAVVAEDLSQEAMLTLWRKAHLYDASKASVSTWLFRIARNQMIDQLRRERGIAYEDEGAVEELIVDDAGPAEADAAVLRRKLTQLADTHSELVYKSYFEGKSHAEIAAETGQPLGSVKSRLRAALKSLRHQFDAEVD